VDFGNKKEKHHRNPECGHGVKEKTEDSS